MSHTVGNLVYGIRWNKKLDSLWNAVEDNSPSWAEDLPEIFGFEEIADESDTKLVAYLGESLLIFAVTEATSLSELTQHAVLISLRKSNQILK